MKYIQLGDGNMYKLEMMRMTIVCNTLMYAREKMVKYVKSMGIERMKIGMIYEYISRMDLDIVTEQYPILDIVYDDTKISFIMYKNETNMMEICDIYYIIQEEQKEEQKLMNEHYHVPHGGIYNSECKCGNIHELPLSWLSTREILNMNKGKFKCKGCGIHTRYEECKITGKFSYVNWKKLNIPNRKCFHCNNNVNMCK